MPSLLHTILPARNTIGFDTSEHPTLLIMLTAPRLIMSAIKHGFTLQENSIRIRRSQNSQTHNHAFHRDVLPYFSLKPAINLMDLLQSIMPQQALLFDGRMLAVIVLI